MSKDVIQAVSKIIAAPKWWTHLFTKGSDRVDWSKKFVPDTKQVNFAKMELDKLKGFISQTYQKEAKADLSWKEISHALGNNNPFYKGYGFRAYCNSLDQGSFDVFKEEIEHLLNSLHPALKALMYFYSDWHNYKGQIVSTVTIGLKDPNSMEWSREGEARFAWESIDKNDTGRKL